MMSVPPQGEHIRNAVKWISDQRKYEPDRKLIEIIEEAGLKFNLSPADIEFVSHYVKEGNGASK